MSLSTSKKEPLLKSYFTDRRPKKSPSAELENALYENAQLENENRALKSELVDLRIKNENLMKALNSNKQKFEQDFNNLQDEIKKNEKNLIENSKRCLEQQKKSVEEVKRLKEENEELKISNAKSESASTEKLKSFESELKLLKLDNENLNAQNQENVQKCTRYKNKLKNAVKVVNELNNLVVQYTNKPGFNMKTTQTDTENNSSGQNILDCSQCADPAYKRNITSENLLLSDIFFKPKSFCDSDLALFNSKSKCS